MNRILSTVSVFLLSGLFCFSAKADNSGSDQVTCDYQVGEFTSFEVNVPADIVYESGRPFLSIAGQEKALSYIEVKSENGQLVVKSKKKFKNFRKLSIIASSDCLEHIRLNGAAEFECERGFDTESLTVQLNGACELDLDNISADKMDFTLNGAGEIDLEHLNCLERINVVVNGAGSAKLSGTAGSADLKINGAGSVDAKELNCKNVSSSVNGVGSIKTR